jgi:hypothetical protein
LKKWDKALLLVPKLQMRRIDSVLTVRWYAGVARHRRPFGVYEYGVLFVPTAGGELRGWTGTSKNAGMVPNVIANRNPCVAALSPIKAFGGFSIANSCRDTVPVSLL